jgi:hypothetical protein
MKHEMTSMHVLRSARVPFGLLVGLILAAARPHPSPGAEAPKTGEEAAPKPGFECSEVRAAIDRLVCVEPSLAALNSSMEAALRDSRDAGEGDARLAEQRLWLERRAKACPEAAQPPADPAPRGAWHDGAIACLSRIYEQRVAVLRYEGNAAAWPRLRFRPTLVEGAGTKLCEDLQRDLLASFLGSGLFVNPLGEREIGFASMPGLGGDPELRQADIDVYNLGKPSPVLQWIEGDGGSRISRVEYRAFGSSAELLSAIGRGIEPLAHSVREAARPVIDVDRLPRADPKKPRAAFARASVLTLDEMPRFFTYDNRVYLLGPMHPVPGKPGDLGVYRLYGPGQLHRICLFDAHVPVAHLPDQALALPEVAAMERAAGPLLPTGRLCTGLGDEARTLGDHAAWRPWVLDRRRTPGGSNGEQLARYMHNRALTGPEKARQYRAYLTARNAAVEAVGLFYRNEFGRTPTEATRLAAFYLDHTISDGFELDPDGDQTAILLADDFVEKHAAQQAALAGDTAVLRDALGPEPRAVAKGVKGDLDEPIVSDALEHSETLRALLDLGLDPNELGASGRTPLMLAARLDLVEAADMLLAQGAALDTGAGDAIAQTDSTGDPLCMSGDAASGDVPGRTALSYAAELGSPAMVRLLLDRGADPARPDSVVRRPVDYLKNRTGDPAQSAAIAEMLK